MIAALRRVARETRGGAIVEFAIVAPVLILMIMGFCDLCYRQYVQAVLEGAVQKAGRDSTIEDYADNTAPLDAKVEAMVNMVAPGATYPPAVRESFQNYGNRRPEQFSDGNGNGRYDAGECFWDVNGNGVWDQDPGTTGQGDASDVTIYTKSVTFPRLFPMARLLGWSNTQTVSATTFLKNQPYHTQTTIAVHYTCP